MWVEAAHDDWELRSYIEEGSHRSAWRFLVKHKFGVDMYTL